MINFFSKAKFFRYSLLVILLGHSVFLDAQVNISGIVNTYTAVTAISQPVCGNCDPTCFHTITVTNAAGLQPGDRALIIQMKGADINTANAAGSGNITNINNAGNYEFFEIGSIAGNVLTPRYPLIRQYTVSGMVQVVRIPQFSQTVNISAPLTALDWNESAGIGGVVAIEAKKVVFGANIEMSGRGFQGIQMPFNSTPDDCSIVPTTQFVLPSNNNSSYTKGDGIVVNDPATNRGRSPRANGGGSGVSGDSGGGGGSNYGAGGEGGKRWCNVSGANAGGVGGFSLTSFLAQDKVFLGGAGGPGWVSTNNPSTAADGGGIVIIFADTIVGNGFTVNCNGLSPVAVNPVGNPDGGGGGGAGGTVVLKAHTYQSTLNVNAAGGQGQDLNTTIYHGPGGGGGGGVLLYSLAALPININLNVTAGQGGVHSDGFRNDSQNGQAGGSISLYVPIQNPNYEFNIDTDNILSTCDIDDDNDGISDINELYWRDHDNDGTPDYADPQFCAATFQGVNGWVCGTMGLPEPNGDMDGDGRPNYQDPDFPYCGGLTNGQICRNWDSDGDGNINSVDLDSDNDGIADLVEAGGVDTNGDGQIDGSADADGDGLLDAYDNNDTDGPTGASPCSPLPHCLATTSTSILFDTNNNGLHDRNADADRDGIPNMYDLDADNDGIPDLVEAGGTDVNGDGYVDTYNPGTGALSGDADKDGFTDTYDGSFETCTTSSSGTSSTVNTVVNGTSTVAFTTTGITTPTNAVGAANGTIADFYDNDDVLTLDLGQLLPTGATITVVWRKRSGQAGTVTPQFGLSLVNNAFTTVVFAPANTTSTAFINSTHTLTTPAQVIRIANTDGLDFEVDAVTWSYTISVTTTTYPTTCVNSAGNPLVVTGADSNADGQPNSYTEGDADRDVVPNFLDLDADNDGIADVVEALGTDANGDGLADNYADTDGDGFNDSVDGDVNNDGTAENAADVLVLTGPDANSDGTPDTYPNGDFDGDLLYNFLDLDADNDGAQDILEVGGTDANNDGLVDGYTDTDGDGWSQNVDGDLNNDGNIDNAPAVLVITGNDANSDGNADSYAYTDNVDSHGLPNFLDLDSDNDGITDVVENNAGNVSGAADTDNPTGAGSLDGYAGNGGITDADNNGWHDPSQGVGLQDSDNDGVADLYDIDADNDGIMDMVEGTGSFTPMFDPLVNPSLVDANGNGVLDEFENLLASNNYGGTNVGFTPNEDDNDGSGPADYLDFDTDNDGHMDWAEGFDDGFGGAAAFNSNAVAEMVNMANDFKANYEAAYGAGLAATFYPATDIDGDGIPVWLDSDDLTVGYNINALPPFLNPASPFWIDEDKDGLVDIFDALNNIDGFVLGNLSPVQDADNANDRDWRDDHTQVDFPIELLFFNAEKQGNHALLTWATATEIDNDFFVVERSANGVDFIALGQVDGAGTTTEEQHYAFMDEMPFAGINYYRLRQVDFDEKCSYTEIRALDFSSIGSSVSILPNPTKGTVSVNIRAAIQQTAKVELMDELGRVLQQFSVEPAPSMSVQLDLSNLPSAVYIVRITSGNQQLALEKVVKN